MMASRWRDVAGNDVVASRVANKVNALSLEHFVHIWCLYRKYCLLNHLSLECMVSGSSSWKNHLLHCLLACVDFVKTFENADPSNKHFERPYVCVTKGFSSAVVGNQEGPASIGARQNLWCAPGFLSGFGASASGFICGFILHASIWWIPCRCIHARCIWVALLHTSSHGYWVGGVSIFSSKMSLDRCVSRLASQINVFRLIH